MHIALKTFVAINFLAGLEVALGTITLPDMPDKSVSGVIGSMASEGFQRHRQIVAGNVSHPCGIGSPSNILFKAVGYTLAKPSEDSLRGIYGIAGIPGALIVSGATGLVKGMRAVDERFIGPSRLEDDSCAAGSSSFQERFRFGYNL